MRMDSEENKTDFRNSLSLDGPNFTFDNQDGQHRISSTILQVGLEQGVSIVYI